MKLRSPSERALADEGRHSQAGYRPDIDGLRAIAVLAVLGFHAFPSVVRGGFAGVDVFYVISGFLISSQILNHLAKGRFRFFDFYSRRIRRLFPALLLVLAACFALGWFGLFASEYTALGRHMAAGAAFVSNLVFWNESGYFDSSAQTKPLLHLWSLSVEEQFYLLWPLLLLFTFRRAALVATAVFAASFFANLYWIGRDASGAFYLPVTRFWELMAGSLLACWGGTKLRRHAEIIAALGLALVLGTIALLPETFAFPGWWALLPVAGTAGVIAAGDGAWINRRLLNTRVLVFIGLISYPLYLWHWPLLSFGRIFQSEPLTIGARIAILGVSALLAWFTYRIVELPIRHDSKGPVPVAALASFIAILGAAGFVVYRADGLPSRAANFGDAYAADLVMPGSSTISDGTCRALFRIEPIRNEVCLASSAHPEVLILGDSHAMALNAAVHLGKVPISTVLIGAYACLPLVDYAAKGVRNREPDSICAATAHQGLAFAAEHKEIQTVVLHTRGPVYFSGTGFGVEVDDPARQPFTIVPLNGADTLADRERFQRGYSRLISDLEGMGKRVIFAMDVPELGLDPRSCLPGRPLTFSTRAVSPCTQPRTAVDQRMAEYRAIIGALQAEHPRMRVFDPTPLFCDAQVCRGKDDRHIYYYDSDHLSAAGSERVWSALLPFVREGRAARVVRPDHSARRLLAAR